MSLWLIVVPPVLVVGLGAAALLAALRELGAALESLDLELRGV